ncbi:NAD(P)/FAD-dependent oxidoreductase [Corallincola platygyrae]
MLGGGIAGISACYHAQLLGMEAEVYEASDVIGGLVSNFEIDGFRFDNAVHLSFTKDPYVKELFSRTPFYCHKPDSYCYEDGHWLKHPVQNNLYPLPLDDKIKLIESFIQRPDIEPTHYKEWLVNQYGHEIAERYPLAYTRKYWGLDADMLSLDWIGNRMRRAELKEVLAGALEKRNDNHYYANEMRYPKQGGYRSFINPMLESVEVRTNHKVVQIDPSASTVVFEGGKMITYEQLVSSIPLPSLVPLIKGTPECVVEAAKSLLYTRVDLVSVGFSREDVPPYLWFYIYGDEHLAARGYSPSWKSPENAPEGYSSLQFEIYSLSGTPLLEPERLIENVKLSLKELGICQQDEILFCHHKHLPFGNVIFDHGMEERRKIVRDYLDSLNIVCCGRFGEWDYLWSDQSLVSGMNAINKL